LDEVRSLGRLELLAHDAGVNHPATWGALALVYAARPVILAKLVVLEFASVADLVRFLAADNEARAVALERVIIQGGIYATGGQFVDLGS
jgi:hypothetical protein